MVFSEIQQIVFKMSERVGSGYTGENRANNLKNLYNIHVEHILTKIN